MALVATIAGIASVSAASASFVWLQNSQKLLVYDGDEPSISKKNDITDNNNDGNESDTINTERDATSEAEGSSISTKSSFSSLQLNHTLSSSMTIYDLENPIAAEEQRLEISRRNSSSITHVDIPLAYEQKAAQEKAARLQRLLAMAADTEKDKENERRIQEMRAAQEARLKANKGQEGSDQQETIQSAQNKEPLEEGEEEEAEEAASPSVVKRRLRPSIRRRVKKAMIKREIETKLAEEIAMNEAKLARLKAIQEQQQLEEAEEESLIINEQRRIQIQIVQEEKARQKKLEDAQKTDVLVLALKVIKVKNIAGPLATSVPLTKISPFFEIDRVRFDNVDKKGRKISEFVFRSDYIANDDNPEWGPIMVNAEDLCGGNRDQTIIIRVMDHGESGSHVYIGEFQTTINELLNSTAAAAADDDDDEHSSKVFKLKKDDKTSGKIVVTSANVEKILPTNPTVGGMLKLNLKGERFKNFSVLSKSSPFFEVSRMEKETGKPILVYRSPYIKNNLWPDWKVSIIEMDKLFVNGMDQTAIRFDVYDHNKKGSHEFMGSFETTMAGLVKSSETDAPFEMLSREGESNGTIFVEMIEVVPQEKCRRASF